MRVRIWPIRTWGKRNPAWQACLCALYHTVFMHTNHFNFPYHQPKDKTCSCNASGNFWHSDDNRTFYGLAELIFIDLNFIVSYLLSICPEALSLINMIWELITCTRGKYEEAWLTYGYALIWLDSKNVVRLVKGYILSLESPSNHYGTLSSIPAILANLLT